MNEALLPEARWLRMTLLISIDVKHETNQSNHFTDDKNGQ